VSTAEVEGIVSNLINYRDCIIYGVEVMIITFMISQIFFMFLSFSFPDLLCCNHEIIKFVRPI